MVETVDLHVERIVRCTVFVEYRANSVGFDGITNSGASALQRSGDVCSSSAIDQHTMGLEESCVC